LRQARAAARFSETPTSLRRGAPRLGEHTEEVLREVGLADDEIDRLRRQGIIGADTG
jgi:formyl-CoA transferase